GDGEKVERTQPRLDPPRVGRGHDGVRANDQQRPHSVRLAQRREQLVGGAARAGDLLLLDLPDLCEMAPRRGIVDAPVAGELVGCLPVLAAGLSVALPGQPAVSGDAPPLPAEGERDVDESERVGTSLRLLLWPAA